MTYTSAAQREKTLVALTSVAAAIGLTGIKFVVALMTGSLGILAEAAHSGLDLVAALMTFFAVRVADRPADAEHNYGHGKIENISAFLQALLLLLTAAWVSYEAVRRLLFQEGHVDVTIWAFAVMVVSIVVDYSRSRALLRVARKLGSQALEADALHFSTDIWSSAVVIFGLLVVYLTQIFHWPAWLVHADAVAALGVSAIVIWVSLKLSKETIDALVDRVPGALAARIQARIDQMPDVVEVRRVRVRRAGNKYFADIIIAASRTLSFEEIHALSDLVEEEVMLEVHAYSDNSDIDAVVHVEPVASPQETVADQIHYQAKLHGVHAHDIHVREVEGKLEADFDLEVQVDMDLQRAHEIATQLEQSVLHSNDRLHRVTTHLEAPESAVVPRQEVTAQYPSMASDICRIADTIAGSGSAHDVHLYKPRLRGAVVRSAESRSVPDLDLVLHTTFEGQAPLSQVHVNAEEIKRSLRRAYPNLNSVTIHTEPAE